MIKLSLAGPFDTWKSTFIRWAAELRKVELAEKKDIQAIDDRLVSIEENMGQVYYKATQLFTDKTGALEVKQAYNGFGNGTAANVLVAGVSGKKIRVLSILATTNSATNWTEFVFDGNSGYLVAPARQSNPGVLDIQRFPIGIFETAVGAGVLVSVGSNAGLWISIRYIEVTP